jgi:hypothetical protein
MILKFVSQSIFEKHVTFVEVIFLYSTMYFDPREEVTGEWRKFK